MGLFNLGDPNKAKVEGHDFSFHHSCSLKIALRQNTHSLKDDLNETARRKLENEEVEEEVGDEKRSKKTPQEMQQKVKMAPPNKDETPSRRVSIFSLGWGISVGVKTIDVSKLILKEVKKKKHEQWRMKNALAEMITATTPHIIRTYKKFYKHHTSLKLKKLKHRIKSSSSNWRKSVAMDKLSNIKMHNENVKHQVKTNGWQPWH
ncbi:hypothetical protein DVH24_022086 [Malus domestica]|uniref:Uncharacterized protein n=1 Tax=Malus domestica TaxID=3750 RepID=A0A498IZ64_MALDO|nr:hypothetical protein DVH24_022086 [Malus domestica]